MEGGEGESVGRSRWREGRESQLEGLGGGRGGRVSWKV